MTQSYPPNYPSHFYEWTSQAVVSDWVWGGKASALKQDASLWLTAPMIHFSLQMAHPSPGCSSCRSGLSKTFIITFMFFDVVTRRLWKVKTVTLRHESQAAIVAECQWHLRSIFLVGVVEAWLDFFFFSPPPPLPQPPPPPDTCLAHENGETCPCQRGEKRIHRPQCGDLTVSPQTTVNTNYFWHFVKYLVLQIRPDFPFGGWNGNVTIISTWFQSDYTKSRRLNTSEHIV